jgi:hypothetical protein
MNNMKEEEFISYWKEKRTESKLNPFLFLKGFAGGLIIGLLVFISMLLGWYKRANMDAANKLNPIVLLICILAIGTFIAIFYTYFKFEQNEQLYQEILKKREKQTNN